MNVYRGLLYSHNWSSKELNEPSVRSLGSRELKVFGSILDFRRLFAVLNGVYNKFIRVHIAPKNEMEEGCSQPSFN